MNKPKMRPITIEIAFNLQRVINIETLTDKAAGWIQQHAPEFGEIYKSAASDKQYHLYVHRGFNCDEVLAYLNDKWDSESWPKEVEDSITTDAEKE